MTVRGGGRSPASSHCFSRENSMRSPRSGRSSRAPISGAQPQPSRCSVAFEVHAPSRSRQSGSPSTASSRSAICCSAGRRVGFARRRLQPQRPAQPRRGRHREPRRMNEGEQLEQVEPAELGIAEPLPDQRRVEDDVRSLGRARDRLAAARLAHLSVAARQPDTGVGCVERGKRQRSRHPRDPAATRTEEQRIWTPKRFEPPHWRPRPGPTRKRASS